MKCIIIKGWEWTSDLRRYRARIRDSEITYLRECLDPGTSRHKRCLRFLYLPRFYYMCAYRLGPLLFGNITNERGYIAVCSFGFKCRGCLWIYSTKNIVLRLLNDNSDFSEHYLRFLRFIYIYIYLYIIILPGSITFTIRQIRRKLRFHSLWSYIFTII